MNRILMVSQENKWDTFICHASEDKEAFVLALAQGLQKEGFKIWVDEWCLDVGDSISQSIEEGLRNSRYGIVVLSQAFFMKAWPKKELSALLAKESTTARVILPVLYQLSFADVYTNAPLLADRVAAKSEDGLPQLSVGLLV